METKKCKYCKEEKELENFYKHKITKDGYNTRCKVCINKIKSEKTKIERDRKLQKLECRECLKFFKQKTTIQKYCSDKCRAKHNILKYNNSKKGKTSRKRYFESDKGKIAIKKNNIRQAKKIKELRKIYTKNILENAMVYYYEMS